MMIQFEKQKFTSIHRISFYRRMLEQRQYVSKWLFFYCHSTVNLIIQTTIVEIYTSIKYWTTVDARMTSFLLFLACDDNCSCNKLIIVNFFITVARLCVPLMSEVDEICQKIKKY